MHNMIVEEEHYQNLPNNYDLREGESVDLSVSCDHTTIFEDSKSYVNS